MVAPPQEVQPAPQPEVHAAWQPAPQPAPQGDQGAGKHWRKERPNPTEHHFGAVKLDATRPRRDGTPTWASNPSLKFVRVGAPDVVVRGKIRFGSKTSKEAAWDMYDDCMLFATRNLFPEYLLHDCGASRRRLRLGILGNVSTAVEHLVRHSLGYNAHADIFLVGDSYRLSEEAPNPTTAAPVHWVRFEDGGSIPASVFGGLDREIKIESPGASRSSGGSAPAAGPLVPLDVPNPAMRSGDWAADHIATANRNCLLTGGAGTGKTKAIVRQIVPKLQEVFSEDELWLCGTTNMVANIFRGVSQGGGSTIHSMSGLGRGKTPVSEAPRLFAGLHPKVLARWRLAKVMLIDEAGMMDGDFLDLIDAMGRLAKDPSLPFGGILMILVGDFFQLEPVPHLVKDAFMDGNQYFRRERAP